ncbi:MAG TPA: class I SAM-dependent methyltransferase [Candidatus Koribacter sp.]|jgi:methyltransferase-like protein/ubiquinone/menaquinone biosynthesis C-methylase UbiE
MVFDPLEPLIFDDVPAAMNFYDNVPYPTFVQEQTHPDRMHVIASLFGMAPKAVDEARVLEIGCGDGNNIIPIAYCHSRSKFIGIDIAEQPIDRGREAIRNIGLGNIQLEVRDLTKLDRELGQFDYIIAHGIYAWVPEQVRDALLGVCREHLQAGGIAYISYNALPGGHARRIIRDFMLFHTRSIHDPDEKIREAEGILDFAIESTPREDYYDKLLEHRQKTMPEGTALFHDDLNDIYEPVYAEQFLDQAAKHDLGYVGEADFFEMSDAMYPQTVRERLNQLSRGDRIRKEQYMDFLSGRGFRQTLVCRKEDAPDGTVHVERVRSFYVSTTMAPTEVEGEFTTKSGRKIKTNHPVVVEKLKQLCDLWPGSLPVQEVTGGDALLEKYLFQLYSANFVQFHSHGPCFTTQPGERPEASAVARYQAIQGEFVATLAQHAAHIDTDIARKFLLKLDGTRTREELAEEMEKPLEIIDENLRRLVKLGLLRR